MATVGRMYACQLITFHPTANKAVKEQELDLLRVPLITAMLQMMLDGTPLDCARCGTTEVLRYKQRYANRLKVDSLHCSSRLRLRRAVIECPEYVGIPYQARMLCKTLSCHRCAGDATLCGTAVLNANLPRGQNTKVSAESIVAGWAGEEELNAMSVHLPGRNLMIYHSDAYV